LLELEARQNPLKEVIEQAPPPAPFLHPKLAEVYRAIVADLHVALSDPGARTEAAEILRGLIECITVRSGPGGHVVELTGDIVKLLTRAAVFPFRSIVR
jgi:site-specific DNA recombinase